MVHGIVTNELNSNASNISVEREVMMQSVCQYSRSCCLQLRDPCRVETNMDLLGSNSKWYYGAAVEVEVDD